MAVPSRPVFGIDVRPEGIWLTEMKGSWPDAQILNAAYAPVPVNAFDEGRLVDKKGVGQILKDLVESLPTNTAEAVLALHERSVDVRVMEVPQVPDSELRMVIEGELAHYQIFANQATALDFTRLEPGEDGLKDSPQVLVVAAEKGAVETCVQLAEIAELNIMAVEPVLSGQYRAAMLTLGHQTEDALIIAVGDTHSEIGIVGQGHIRLYRRANFGNNHLITHKQDDGFPSNLGSWIHAQSNVDSLANADGTPGSIPVPDTLNRDAVANLTMEIRRSLEYYFNQCPHASQIVQAVISVHTGELRPITDVLAKALNLRVDLAVIPQSWMTDEAVAEKLNGDDGLSYIGAAGVAMRHLTGVPASIPALTLTPRSRDEGRLQDVRKRLVFALAASIISIFLGMLITSSFGLKADMKESELKRSKAELLALQRTKQSRLEYMLKQTALQQKLSQQGYPLPTIMDAIARSMDPDSSLVQIALNTDGKVFISGEASSEKSIIETLQNLKSNAFLQDTLLDSFDRNADQGAMSHVERFQVTSHLAGFNSTPAKAP